MRKITTFFCLLLFCFINTSLFANNNYVSKLIVCDIIGKRDFYDYANLDFTSFFGLKKDFYLKFNNKPKKIELSTLYSSIDTSEIKDESSDVTISDIEKKSNFAYEYLNGKLIKLSVNSNSEHNIYNYIYKNDNLYKIDFNNFNNITFEYDNQNRPVKIERIDGLVLDISYFDDSIGVVKIRNITPDNEELYFIFEFKNGLIHKFNNFIDDKYYTFLYLPNSPNNIVERIVEKNSREQIAYYFVYDNGLLKEVLTSAIGIEALWSSFNIKDALKIYQISHRFLLREETNVAIMVKNLYYDITFDSGKLKQQKIYNKKDLVNEKRYDVFENLIFESSFSNTNKEINKYSIAY